MHSAATNATPTDPRVMDCVHGLDLVARRAAIRVTGLGRTCSLFQYFYSYSILLRMHDKSNVPFDTHLGPRRPLQASTHCTAKSYAPTQRRARARGRCAPHSPSSGHVQHLSAPHADGQTRTSPYRGVQLSGGGDKRWGVVLAA